MGNICRSPTAEGVFRKILAERNLEDLFEVDSAGTGNWHEGLPPDTRAQQAALARRIDLSGLRARQVKARDFEAFDMILAMDNDNLTRLRSSSPATLHHKITLLLDHSSKAGRSEVPDPYYGGAHGFDLVLDLIEDACNDLLDRLTVQR